MDAAILFSDILVVPHALGQRVDYLDGEGPRLDPIETAGGLAQLFPERLETVLEPVYEAVRRLTRLLPDGVALIGFAGSPWTVATYMVEGGASKDFARVKGWAYRDPAGFQRLIDILIDATTFHLCAQIRAGAEVVQLFDSWAGVLPSEAFRRWVIEPTRIIADRLRLLHPEVPLIGFPRGAGLHYETYAAVAGVDALGLDTTVPTAWAARVLQPRLPVQGNLDPILLLAGGEALAAGVRCILRDLGDHGFVFNLGHGVVQATPPEHVGELADLLRAWPDISSHGGLT